MAAKTIITDKIDISEYLESYTYYEISLSYLYNTGYILITETDKGNTFFEAFNYNLNPEQLYNNYHIQKVPELWQSIENKLIPYRKKLNRQELDQHEIESEIKNIICDVIDSLTRRLSRFYETDEYTQLKNYDNPAIKEFLLRPVKTFNDLINKNVEPLSRDKARIKRQEVTETLINKITDLIVYFNEQKGIPKETRNGTANLFEDKELLKIFNQELPAVFDNPIFQLHIRNRVDYNKEIATDELIKELHLKRYLNDDTTELYYYDKKQGQFKEITVQKLKKIIKDVYGYTLLQGDITAIFNAIYREDKAYNNLLVFDNVYYDTKNLEVFKQRENYDRGSYLTFNNIGVEQEDGTIKLLEYNQDLYLTDIFTVKELPKKLDKLPVTSYKERYGMTLTELVFRMITTPKNNPADLTLFTDTLERIGSNIQGANQYKTISLYVDDGNSGKTVLNLLVNLIFNRLNYAITPKIFEDQFSLGTFNKRLVLNIDEITANSFDNLKDTLKRVTSNYGKTEAREMYSKKNKVIKTFPNLNIYSNVPLNLDIKDDLALFNRIDYLKFPNVFVTDKEIEEGTNQYPVMVGLEELLKEDYEGLSWLITASILAFKKMKEQNRTYLLKQTTNETINLYLGNDELRNFLITSYEYDDTLPRTQFISIDEIKSNYLRYMKLLNKPVNKKNLGQDIGTKIKEIFEVRDGYKKRINSIAHYSLRLIKSFEELEKERTTIYEINEDITANDLIVLDYSREYRLIYNAIKDGVNTIQELDKKYIDIDNTSIVRSLNGLNLIIKTDYTRLDED